jgi:hypothetical protein
MVFELNNKEFPYRVMLVEVDGAQEEWVISTQSLNEAVQASTSFQAEIIDDTVIFYVDDADIDSPDLAQIVKRWIDIEFKFISYED